MNFSWQLVPLPFRMQGAENCQDALKGHFRTLQFLLLALLGSHSQEKRIIKPWAKIPRGKDPKRCRRAASPRLLAFSYEKKGKAAL